MSNTLLRHWLPRIAVALLVLLIAACNSIKPTQARARDMVLYDFSSAVRWGDFDKAYDFVDPKTKKEHPLTDVERSRFKQVEVSGYDVIAQTSGEGTIDQQVQLGLVNRNTQVPRTIVYHEHWRWDDVIKKWWLTSGLPDISPQ
jgi:hypothetical protein